MIVESVYKKRNKDVHKYDFGCLLVIGGSKIYSGSPAFNALAALRSGVDIVEIAAPERAANIIASFLPDLITYPLKGDYFVEKHLKEIFRITKNKTACIIGGGLGRKKETFRAVQEFLKKINLPCVIDADAIYAVSEMKECLKTNFVLTPHSYEFYILCGEKIKNDINERKKQVKKVARACGCVILLKGYVDIISDGDQIYVNRTGTPYMTKGGTGDTLAGICGALLARNIKPIDAAYLSAYINGKAGELASKKYGESLLASDVINEIHNVINKR